MLENYKIDKNGVIHQLDYKIIEYNPEYIEKRYYQYPEKCVNMGYLRLGYLIGSLGHIPTSILDVGYGSGDFLKVCKEIIPDCYGYDITTIPPPEGVKLVTSIYENYYEVISFFDVLEHFEDINEIKKLNCSYIFISLPWCHNHSDEWFKDWKHRRPNEHLHHFNENSLDEFLKEIGYIKISATNIEDTIRKTDQKDPNILSAIYKKIK
jgi:hypothetical protein